MKMEESSYGLIRRGDSLSVGSVCANTSPQSNKATNHNTAAFFLKENILFSL